MKKKIMDICFVLCLLLSTLLFLLSAAADTSCPHWNTHDVVTLEATCATAGLKDVVCDNCGSIIATDVEVAIDPDNHIGHLALAYNKNEAQEIDYYCDACDAVIVEDYYYANTIYVSTTGVEIAMGAVTEDNLLGTEDNPFANFADAMEYAALATEQNEDAVTVHILDSATTGSNYQTPVCDFKITVTGGTCTIAPGFASNGPIAFEDISLHAATVTVRASICAQCEIGNGVVIDIEPVLSLSGVYTDGENKLRFVTKVTPAADMDIEYFGTYIVPLSYFTEHELTAGGGEQPGVAAIKYTQSIENGASFAADLDGIPGAYVDTPIFAWSFVKFQGIDAVYTQVLGSFTVSGARLVKGGF